MNEIVQLVKIMDDISSRMSEQIFENDWKSADANQHYLLALFQDAFKTVQTFCQAMRIGAISQSGMLLRLLLEQTSIIKVLCEQSKLLPVYVRHFKFRGKINLLSKNEQIKAIKEEFGFDEESPRLLGYLDYGWLGEEAAKQKNLEDFLIRKAGFDDFISWRKKLLDKFSHGSFTFVNFADPKEGSTLTRAFTGMACKLFDNLCCQYHNIAGFGFAWENEKLYLEVFLPLYSESREELKLAEA